MLISAKLTGPKHYIWAKIGPNTTYFLKLYMGVYLRAKFEVSSMILTSFRPGGGGVILPPSPTSKRTPKNPPRLDLGK